MTRGRATGSPWPSVAFAVLFLVGLALVVAGWLS